MRWLVGAVVKASSSWSEGLGLIPSSSQTIILKSWNSQFPYLS